MTVVIIGAGHAAGQLTGALRMQSFDGGITVVGEESYLPYQRPPLSKQFLGGELEQGKCLLHDEHFYEEAKVHVRLGTRADAIDRVARTVRLSNGQDIAYEHLALTTGARVCRLDLPGADLGNIFYLRGIDDSLAIRQHFGAGARLVVVGGGYIGLEVAAVAVKAGLKVTILEMAERVMNRVVAPEVSVFYEELHHRNGVEIRTGVAVKGFEGDGVVSQVLTDGEPVPCDVAVVGVGIVPNTELAEAAGLDVDNGIVVDEYTRTADERIVAAGDCTNHPNGIYGRRMRLESVQNAVDQANAAAKSICGKPEPYEAVPWFWSDQYDVKLQISGMSQGYDETVVRGDPADGAFSVFYLKAGVVIAVDAVNSPREYMMGKRLVAAHAAPAPARIADSSVPVKELV